MPDQELDVRPLPKPDKHPRIFELFGALALGESFVLVNNHDPKHLRREFEKEHPSGFGWDYLDRGPAAWRIRISKLASTPVPRILCDAREIAAGPYDPGVAGAVWKLEMSQRHLDSNIIRLPPESRIDAHTGPDLDVLILVLDGGGELVTETGTLGLHPGALAWLPRLSRREITASVAGLSYLTVHPRRPSLGIEAAPSARLSGSAAQRPGRAGRRTDAQPDVAGNGRRGSYCGWCALVTAGVPAAGQRVRRVRAAASHPAGSGDLWGEGASDGGQESPGTAGV